MAISPTLFQLITLLADGQFHSGTELAQATGISRSAISKQLHNLDALGIQYIAISGRGYKLEQPLQLLDKQSIRQSLTPQAATYLKHLEIHTCLASTNAYLQQSAQHGAACFAEYQTAGRGRRGRQWVSPFGRNIYLSLRYHYQTGPAALAGLSLAVGVATIRALQTLNIPDVGLKWPNDIIWQQQKLGGILLEVGGEAEGPSHVIVGLGLNGYVSESASGQIDQPWTDLNRIIGMDAFKLRNRLAAALLNQLLPVVHDFEHTGLAPFIEEWRQYDCLKGKKATLYQGAQQQSGTICGIDQTGQLLLEDSAGTIKPFASGEVSFRL